MSQKCNCHNSSCLAAPSLLSANIDVSPLIGVLDQSRADRDGAASDLQFPRMGILPIIYISGHMNISKTGIGATLPEEESQSNMCHSPTAKQPSESIVIDHEQQNVPQG